MAHDQPGLFAAIGALDWYARSHRHWIDDQAVRSGDRVLEVGCATGALTAYLAGRGYRVTGLDRSGDMIARARNDHADLEFRVGDATSLPYDDKAFDAVVAASVVNVVDQPQLVVSEMNRVCASGGTVSVLAPAAGFSDADLDSVIKTLGVAGFSDAALRTWHGSARKMSRSYLEALFRGVGLGSVTIHSYLSGMLIAASATSES